MPQPALLGKLQRKASHRNKESVKLRFHVVVYSVTGAPRSVGNAIFSLERGEHAFESNTAAQSDGSFFWNERISQVVTLYRNDDGSYEDKEYKLVLHEAVSTPKGDKRGAAFGRARLNLSKYASATVGKRVVLTLAAEGPACAGGDKARAITAVVTVAAEPSDKTPTGSSNALDEVGASAAKADLDDDGDDDDSAHASAPGALALPVFDCGGSSEDEDGAPMTPHAHVAPAAGAKSKPLPAPPAPAQLAPRAVEWRGVGAGTVAETQRLFAACCPCFAPRVESFEPLR